MLVTALVLVRQHVNALTTRWWTHTKKAFTPYRPELHYMRGRGPKWHAKHRPGHDVF